MSNELGGISNAAVRGTIGSYSQTKAGLAIDGVNSENVETTAAVEHCINGVPKTDLAIKAEIDLSAASFISAKDGSALDGPVAIPAIAAGGDAITKVYILACNGDNVYVVEPELDTAADDPTNHPLTCPAGYAPFGAIKIECAPTPSVGVATFLLGTTDLTGVTNQTVTFTDLFHVPPSVDDLN